MQYNVNFVTLNIIKYNNLNVNRWPLSLTVLSITIIIITPSCSTTEQSNYVAYVWPKIECTGRRLFAQMMLARLVAVPIQKVVMLNIIAFASAPSYVSRYYMIGALCPPSKIDCSASKLLSPDSALIYIHLFGTFPICLTGWSMIHYVECWPTDQNY